jgi:hypothetical protein
MALEIDVVADQDFKSNFVSKCHWCWHDYLR